MNKKIKYRQGHFIYTLRLKDSINSSIIDEYKDRVYVEEIDKYTDGTSKLKLIEIETYYGFDTSQYDYVKKCIKLNFSSIMDTSDITWLVSEIDLKQERKDKLDKINNKNFIQKLFSK